MHCARRPTPAVFAAFLQASDFRPARGRGHTLLEMVMVVGLFMLVTLGITELLRSTSVVAAHSEVWANLTEWGQRGVNGIGTELVALRKIYQDDAFGNLYLNSLQAPGTFARLGNGVLPVCDDTGTFHTDAPGSPRTGNQFLFLRQRTPFEAALAPAGSRRVDLYSLVHYYLSPVARSMGPYTQSLILARWESVVYADYEEVLLLPAPERTQVVAQLFTDAGVQHLLRTASAADQAFFEIDGGGAIAGAPDPLYQPVQARNTSVLPSLGLGAAGVAWNRTAAVWVKEPVPQFGLASSAGAGFPHGFEVQVIGPTGARTVLLRLVLVQWAPLDRNMDSFACSLVSNAREF